MAKDNQPGATVQYKVLLKPTEVGLLVMRRMQRPHIDKSAELRRFIELGYAAERAGFILDGTVLCHAGRMWDTQPDFGDQSQSHKSSAFQTEHSVQPQGSGRSSKAATPGDRESTLAGAISPAEDTADTDSTLRSKLRGLSG